MRELYICTPERPDENGVIRRAVIGVLREIKPGTGPYENGEYEFEYKLGGKFRARCTNLFRLDDPNKTYNNEEIADLISEWLPAKKNAGIMEWSLKQYGFDKYDEWEWIKRQGCPEFRGPLSLYETLPEDGSIIKYEQF